MRRKVPPAPDSDWTDPVRSLAFLSPRQNPYLRSVLRTARRDGPVPPDCRTARPAIRSRACAFVRRRRSGGGADLRTQPAGPTTGVRCELRHPEFPACTVRISVHAAYFRRRSPSSSARSPPPVLRLFAACVPDATSASAPGPYAPVAGRLCELMLPVPHGGACRAAAPGELARRTARRFR